LKKQDFGHIRLRTGMEVMALSNKPEYGFGLHLMMDGYGCDPALLDDINYIYDFLSDYPAEMAMTKIMPPYVFRYEARKPEDSGISGFVLIAESHISIHTFPEKNYLSLDIFSCKPFDVDKAVKAVAKYFKIKKKELNVVNRGQEFPNNIRQSSRIVQMDRLRHHF